MSYKRYISFLLIVAHCIAVFQFTVPYLSYYANYHYFAEVACVNKNKPQLQCDGQCQLQKMVQNEHRHAENNSKATIEHSIRFDFFFQQYFSYISEFQTHTQAIHPVNKAIHSLFALEPLTPPPQIS